MMKLLNAKKQPTTIGLLLFSAGFIVALLLLGEINSSIPLYVSYAALLVSVMVFGLFVFEKRITWEIALVFLFVWGLIIRLILMYRVEILSAHHQHDIFLHGFGHWHYIQYVATEFRLPVGTQGQMYQPPVHYLILAPFYWLGTRLDMSVGHLCASVMVFMNITLFFVVKKMFRLFEVSEQALFWGLALFYFAPMNIIVASWLNNDPTLLFFSVLIIYFLLKWIKAPTLKNAAYVGLCPGLPT